ncbi:MAG: hypothetical protein U1G07_26230, partial [Verrucomicrobiota bacterium]
RFMATTNPFDYDLMVSTNYYATNGFNRSASVRTNAANVNYDYLAGGGSMANAGRNDWIQNIANLQYDPRPPVFIATNRTGLRTNDFRFFVDLNRNGWFEPSGWLVANEGRRDTNYYSGDPQWIGVLEHPDRPHSESNRFIGRYAFAILPAGRSLDINFIHNDAKRLRQDVGAAGFVRNQGVGPWEINLAGFFAALNTNINAWGVLNQPALAYNYVTNLNFASGGLAFEDARRILQYRYETNLGNLAPAATMLNLPLPPNAYTTNGVDLYSDQRLTLGDLNAKFGRPGVPWSGSPNPNGFYDIQELFDASKTSPGFVGRLTNNAGLAAIPYNRYTFYRLISQLGTDSGGQSNRVYFSDYQLHPTNRMHLQYRNPYPNAQTNLVRWTRLTNSAVTGGPETGIDFFLAAADRILRANMERLVLAPNEPVLAEVAGRLQQRQNTNLVSTNFMIGLSHLRRDFSVTNIQLCHDYEVGLGPGPYQFYMTNNEYSAGVHRLLQVAANLYDANTVRRQGTTNDYPSVFRPVFSRSSTNLYISGFVDENTTNFLANPWMTIQEATRFYRTPATNLQVNLYGVPIVIGAKKGYPNFNKLVVQTMAEVSRRLQFVKANPGARPNQTNQMYEIGVTNRFGIEGWNSYTNNFNRNVHLQVSGQSIFYLHHQQEGNPPVPLQPHTNFFRFFRTNDLAGGWPGTGTVVPARANPNSFVVPVDTNAAAIPMQAYVTLPTGQVGALISTNSNVFEASHRVPQWWISMTNRLQYILVDNNARPPRIIDFVNLDNLVTFMDVTRGLMGDTNASTRYFGDRPGNPPETLGPGDMWRPDRPGGSLDSPSIGVLNQIGVSIGIPYTGEGTWRNSSGQIQDKENAIEQFKLFMRGGGGLQSTVWQAPFTPSRRLYQKNSWEANDPLVHYMSEDLTDLVHIGTNLFARPLQGTDQAIATFLRNDSFLGRVGERYRPWGGNPNKDPASDVTAMDLRLKDPLVRSSDNWSFPTNTFPNVGWMGQVHRGSPWQTIYLKSALNALPQQGGAALPLTNWYSWAGNYASHPTNDWRLLDLFTVAASDSASRGLMGVNQTNEAAWSAVLSGVAVKSNTTAAAGASVVAQFTNLVVQPNTPQLRSIVAGIARTRSPGRTNVLFRHVGDILSVPELTVASPYLNLAQAREGISDAAYESIPQQILGLLQTDEPRVVVYAFGQSLKPAERSLVTVGNVNPPIFNLCTNYQITGEFSAKAVLRFDELAPQATSPLYGAPMAQKMRAVVESYTVLQPE